MLSRTPDAALQVTNCRSPSAQPRFRFRFVRLFGPEFSCRRLRGSDLSLRLPTPAASHPLALGWANFATRLRRWAIWVLCVLPIRRFIVCADAKWWMAYARLQRSRSLTRASVSAGTNPVESNAWKLLRGHTGRGIRDSISRGRESGKSNAL